jgi:hypothetical protein
MNRSREGGRERRMRRRKREAERDEIAPTEMAMGEYRTNHGKASAYTPTGSVCVVT